jgi:hypothetical protein
LQIGRTLVWRGSTIEIIIPGVAAAPIKHLSFLLRPAPTHNERLDQALAESLEYGLAKTETNTLEKFIHAS